MITSEAPTPVTTVCTTTTKNKTNKTPLIIKGYSEFSNTFKCILIALHQHPHALGRAPCLPKGQIYHLTGMLGPNGLTGPIK